MFKKIFTNTFGILSSRILGFVRDLLTASILGANIYSDIFFVAFKLPNLFRRIFAEGAFTQAFLPSYAAARQKNLFAFLVFWRFFWIIATLTLLVSLLAPYVTKLIAFGFGDDVIEMAAPYVAINFYYLLFIFCVTFLAALLQYREHFATTAFSTALLNLSLITALLLYQKESKLAIVEALSWAVVAGGALQLLVHLLIAYKKGILQKLALAAWFRHKKELVQRDLERFWRNFFPAVWGNSTAQVSAFLDTWLASFLAFGSISYLYYANRILQLPLALFAIATATALFPSISKALAKNEEQKALRFFQKSFWFLLALLSLSAIGGIVLAPEIIWLLFERGSFDRGDTLQSAQVLRMYMIGLVPYGLSKLFLLWIFARHRQKEAARIATYSLIANVFFSLALIYPLQAAGLALASSIAGFVQFGYLLKTFPYLGSLWDFRLAVGLVAALLIELAALLFLKGLIGPLMV